MPGISSLYISISGLRAAQTGLSVTGHNLANNTTVGYVRQQALQHDYFSYSVGTSTSSLMQVGLGTDVSGIRQIRDKYLDITYRQNVSRLGFYSSKYEAGVEIQNIIGEMEGSYSMQSVLEQLWESMQELELNPTALETRGNFLEMCNVFTNKFNTSYDDLYKYQLVLNEEVKTQVNRVNELLENIDMLSSQIAMEESTGDNANDFRDSRNVYLDELSQILDIQYIERPNKHIDIFCNGNDLLVGGSVNRLGLRYTANKCNFVEPVFTPSSTILRYDETGENARALFKLNGPIDSRHENDSGSLLALINVRGLYPANYTQSPAQIEEYHKELAAAAIPPYDYTKEFEYQRQMFNAQNSLIPNLQIKLDTMFNEIVTSINDAVAPPSNFVRDTVDNIWYMADENFNFVLDADGERIPAPFDLYGEQPLTEIFSRNAAGYSDRYIRIDNDTYEYVPPDEIYFSRYAIGNVVMNDTFKDSAGNSKIAVAMTPQIHDKAVLEKLVDKWTTGFIGVDDEQKLNVQDFYKKTVTELAIEMKEAESNFDVQTTSVEQLDYRRQAIMAVSLDEEMTNMMKYQHAYNASARVLNVLDGMIDRIVNGTGRVGI